MVMTTSAREAATFTDPAEAPPAATSFSTAPEFTSKPSTLWPALSRFSAIGRPIFPSPMNPMRDMAAPFLVRRSELVRVFAPRQHCKPEIDEHRGDLADHDPGL